MLSALYRVLTDIGSPGIDFYLRRRLAAGREDADRFSERLGQASRPRPTGRVVWCHAASVGEAASLLLLIERLHDAHPDISVLLTTGTVTAARMMMPRLPSYAVHQYMPVDRVPYVRKFLDHWKPDVAIWIESELWPNTLAALRARDIPAVLLNARMSDKSFRNWRRVKGFSRDLLSSFRLCLAQTEDDRARFVALGARPVKFIGNLKYASTPQPFDKDELQKLRSSLMGCPVWAMASTHRGEEEMALTAHKALAAKHARIVTVIVPRHAMRGDEVARLIEAAGLPYARRSKGDVITADTQIYLADTMGELGLFYALCPVAVMGGSFAPVGGHNPIEPAQLGSAIVFGPSMHNFSEIAREFIRADAAIALKHSNEIAFTVERLLGDSATRDRLSQAARLLAERKRYILDEIVAEMDPFLRYK